jgi:hypothetical protein
MKLSLWILRFANALAVSWLLWLFHSPALAQDCAFTRRIADDYLAQCKAGGDCKYQRDYEKLLREECGSEAAAMPSQPIPELAPIVPPPPPRTPMSAPPKIGKDKDSDNCDRLRRLRDDRLLIEWDRAVKRYGNLKDAQQLNREILTDGLDRLRDMDVASSAILTLKYINDHLQLMASLLCIPLGQANKLACGINGWSSTVVEILSAGNEQQVAQALVEHFAEELVSTSEVAEVLLPVHTYVSERIEGERMRKEYVATRVHVEKQMKILEKRLAKVERDLRSAATRVKAVASARNAIEGKLRSCKLTIDLP